jgi:hypothetical protein
MSSPPTSPVAAAVPVNARFDYELGRRVANNTIDLCSDSDSGSETEWEGEEKEKEESKEEGELQEFKEGETPNIVQKEEVFDSKKRSVEDLYNYEKCCSCMDEEIGDITFANCRHGMCNRCLNDFMDTVMCPVALPHQIGHNREPEPQPLTCPICREFVFPNSKKSARIPAQAFTEEEEAQQLAVIVANEEAYGVEDPHQQYPDWDPRDQYDRICYRNGEVFYNNLSESDLNTLTEAEYGAFFDLAGGDFGQMLVCMYLHIGAPETYEVEINAELARLQQIDDFMERQSLREQRNPLLYPSDPESEPSDAESLGEEDSDETDREDDSDYVDSSGSGSD